MLIELMIDQCEYWYWQLLSEHIYTGAAMAIAVMHQPQSSTTLLSLSDQMHSLRTLVPRLQGT